MALGRIEELPKRVYLSVADGKIVHTTSDKKKEYFSFVEGKLEKIYKSERDFNGEKVLYWYVDLRGSKKELYTLSFPYRSGTFKSIVLCLASCPTLGFQDVKIEPYLKNGFTKVVVSVGGTRLDWVIKELPEVKEVLVGGQRIKDDSERMKLIEHYVEEIKKLL